MTTDSTRIDWTDENTKTWLDSLMKFKGTKSVEITFKKVDGSLRVMNCTLNPELLPKQTEPTPGSEVKERKVNPDVKPVFDMDAQAWRSFRWDSIISVKMEF